MSYLLEGVNRIWEEDSESQIQYLEIMHESVRSMKNIDSLVEAKAFYVPNSTYLKHFFGNEIQSPINSFYNFEGICTWTHYVMFPIWDLSGDVVSLAGYDIMSKAEQMSDIEIEKDNFYRYQNSAVFSRGRYLYMIPGVFEKAVRDGYLLITDGFYDMFSSYSEGFNCASSFGSQVTEHILFILSFIKNVFVLVDNDTAGTIFLRTLQKYRKNVYYIKQAKFSDADDMYKSEYREIYIETIKRAIKMEMSQIMKSPT